MKGFTNAWFAYIALSMALISGIAASNFIPVGCYRDNHNKLARPLPVLVANYRDHNRLNWNDLYNSVVKPCAKAAMDKGYEYFGVQFFGECWSGSHGNVTYNIDGESKRCIEDVGKAYALMVYKKITTETECVKYKTLSKANRAVTSSGGGRCDNSLDNNAWYRFTGAAGDAMAHTCTLKKRCGTLLTGWLNGALPSVREGTVSRKVCFSSKTTSLSGDCCHDHGIVKVRNCGKYYVYGRLSDAIVGCPMRFCGN